MKALVKKIIVSILTWEAKLVLKKYKPKIVAVTGSVGKTSTKDVIFTVLSRFFFVRKSEKSFNSELGVPLTVLGCPNGWNDPLVWLRNILEGLVLIIFPNHYPDWLVLEVGADRPGDIEGITKWVRPDVAVITRLSKVPVHVEYFSSPEEVHKEKGFLARAIKQGGTLVLNADDADVMNFRALTENEMLCFGTEEVADIRGSGYHIVYEDKDGMEPLGVGFQVSHKGVNDAAEIRGGLGVQQMYPALAALAVAQALSLPFDKSVKALLDHEPTRGRMRLLPGVKKTIIIDDSYNSSPVALTEALETLKMIETKGRKVAVLGDMLELGKFSTEEHRKAGLLVGGFSDLLFTVGIRARGIAQGALEAGMDEANIFQYEDSREAGNDLELMMREGDVILVKGSQGIRVERVVEEIMAEPMKKDELLVRQDEEWKGR